MPLLRLKEQLANEMCYRLLGRGLAVDIWRSGGFRKFVLLLAKVGHALQVDGRLRVYAEQSLALPKAATLRLTNLVLRSKLQILLLHEIQSAYNMDSFQQINSRDCLPC